MPNSSYDDGYDDASGSYRHIDWSRINSDPDYRRGHDEGDRDRERREEEERNSNSSYVYDYSSSSSDSSSSYSTTSSSSSNDSSGWGCLILIGIIAFLLLAPKMDWNNLSPSTSSSLPVIQPQTGSATIRPTRDGFRMEVNIRSGAGTTYSSLGTAYTHDQFLLKGETTGSDGYIWYIIDYNNQSGYIRGDLVSLSR